MPRTLFHRLLAAGALSMVALAASAQPIKLAYIEVLSGPFGAVGELGSKNLNFIVDEFNGRGGVLGARKFEVVNFDSKGSPQEALSALKAANDQGIQYIVQGNSSAVAGALIDAINKHNSRSPDKQMVYLNFAAVDPDLTDEKCSFWHFRFDANSDMKMNAITDAIKKDAKVKKVFLINQDYAFGHQVTAAAKSMLAAKRPDVQIVGEDLHPMGKVKDFAPYAAKIRASGADTIITGNWGADLTLLVRAVRDSALNVEWYTYYGGAYGSAAAIGDDGVGKVKVVTEWNVNTPNPKMDPFYEAYKAKWPEPADEFFYYRMKVMVGMLAAAMDKAKSTEPLKVASAMEGMSWTGDMGEVTMRKQDHQLLQPLLVSTFGKVGQPGIRLPIENSGYAFGNAVIVPAKDTALPTNCKMKRPAAQ